jgi:D-serine deaminase-like pyridoxal phosphate-dependent protein
MRTSPLTAALASLDTPALLVDLDLLDVNIARVSAACRERGVNWRPHIKGNKTPAIVARAVAAGAIGVTCAKLGEAEVMAEAGIRDILIANQIVGAGKIDRLLRLRKQADPIVAIDDPAHVAALAAAGPDPERPLRIVVEVDLGMNRAGVPPGPAVAALADAVAPHPGLRFVGVMAWESHALPLPDPEKEETVRAALARLVATADLCREAGHVVSVVSCGGTGTFPYCIAQPGITEVQAGGIIFGDVHYREHYRVDGAQALTVLATVTSRPTLPARHSGCGTQGHAARYCRARTSSSSHRTGDDVFLRARHCRFGRSQRHAGHWRQGRVRCRLRRHDGVFA